MNEWRLRLALMTSGGNAKCAVALKGEYDTGNSATGE